MYERIQRRIGIRAVYSETTNRNVMNSSKVN